jgi:putative aminopeptidase FrvX
VKPRRGSGQVEKGLGVDRRCWVRWVRDSLALRLGNWGAVASFPCMMSNADLALSLLKELTEAHGAPGSEDAVREIFAREMRPVGALTCDRLGSIQCVLPATVAYAPRVMVTAHMDEVGFAIQAITDTGFLQIVPLGGWWTHSLLSQRLRFKNRLGVEYVGIVTSTPPHFLAESERSKVLAIEQLYVDIGATSRDEVLTDFGLRLGDPGVPEAVFQAHGRSGAYAAKAFDNRAGCAVAIQATQAVQRDAVRSCHIHTVLTVQEEVGCRGSVTAAGLAQPDVALVIEGTPADDTPGIPGSSARQGALGRGVQIRLLDPTALMSRRLVDTLVGIAEEMGLPYQLAVRRTGGTDAKSLHVSGLGVPCVVLGVPARYIHSHQSVIQLSDYLVTVELVTAALRRFDTASVASLTDFLPEEQRERTDTLLPRPQPDQY